MLNNKFKLLKYGLLGCVFFVGVCISPSVLAKNISVSNSITQGINDKLDLRGEDNNYFQKINKSVTDKGITITIDEVVCDQYELLINYTIKSEKKIKDLQNYDSDYCSYFSIRHLKIDGEEKYLSGEQSRDCIDDYTYTVSSKIHVGPENLPEVFNIDLNVTDIYNVKGNWNFVFSISKAEVSKNSVKFKPNIKIASEYRRMNVDRVIFSPLNTTIFISGHFKENSENATSMLKPSDWFIFDDKGYQLIPKGAMGKEDDEENTLYYELNFESINNIPKYLTVVPCVDMRYSDIEIEAEEVSEVIDGIYPLELDQGSIGKLIIKEVKTENNKTIVKYNAEGKAPYTQARCLYIKDEEGEDLRPESRRDIIKDKDNPQEFTMEFPALNPNRKYTIYTKNLDSTYKIREDLKFNIDLNN